MRLAILIGVDFKMEQYTTEGIIEIATEQLKDFEDRTEIYFLGDDLYELDNIDLDTVYKHFENKGYDCYMEEFACEYEGTFELEPAKMLVITK